MYAGPAKANIRRQTEECSVSTLSCTSERDRLRTEWAGINTNPSNTNFTARGTCGAHPNAAHLYFPHGFMIRLLFTGMGTDLHQREAAIETLVVPATPSQGEGRDS